MYLHPEGSKFKRWLSGRVVSAAVVAVKPLTALLNIAVGLGQKLTIIFVGNKERLLQMQVKADHNK